MSAKFKIFIVFTLSLFATAVVAGMYIIKQPNSNGFSTPKKQQPISAKEISNEKLIGSPYRGQFKSIPLTRIQSVLKGTDPAALAINAFDTNVSKEVTRKVEVVYLQPNQAMVTITQTNLSLSEPSTIKYRVELTSFGRSLFVNSPPLWQIVWAGSSEQCFADETHNLSSTTCW